MTAIIQTLATPDGAFTLFVDERQRVTVECLNRALDAWPGSAGGDLVHRGSQAGQRRVEQELTPGAYRPRPIWSATGSLTRGRSWRLGG